VNFAKLQATGNDFIVIDARNIEKDWSKLSSQMCDRHFGVGADGLILVTSSKVADLKMRIFNPDGSEAEVCGNGLRCLAKYAIERQIVKGPTLRIETPAGIRTVCATLSQGRVKQVEVNMGSPAFSASDIPVKIREQKAGKNKVDITPILDYPLKVGSEKLAVSLVSVGNPHTVTFISQPVASFPLSSIGPKVEKHPMFPQRTNFEVARVLNFKTIEVRVWERGVGETLSCGSGACAVGVLARCKRLTGDVVDIILTGGKLTVCWDGVGEIYFSGPVEEVFIGEWSR